MDNERVTTLNQLTQLSLNSKLFTKQSQQKELWDLIYGNNLNWLLNLNLIYKTLWTAARTGLLISMLRRLNWFCVISLITVLLMWKWMGLFLTKNHLLRCWVWPSLLNWIVVLTLSLLLKLPPRKLGLWFVLWSLFVPRLFCISINLWYTHIWNTVVTSGLVRLVAPSFAACLEPLAHHRNVASLSLFYRYYFGRCSSELAQLVPLPFFHGRITCYSDRLHDFSVTIPRCYKDVYINSFLSHTARLWNSLPLESFLWSMI